MKLKKIILATAVGLSLFGLTACTSSSSSVNTDVVTMKGDTIEVTDVYNQAVKYPSFGLSQIVQQMTFSKILEQDLGSKVTTQQVTDRFNVIKSQYGDSLDSYLQQQGYTEDTYKAAIRVQLLEQAAIDKDIAATQYTTASIKAAWATYYPEVDTYIVGLASKSDVQKLKDQATSDFAAFKKTADSSGYEQKFDSSNSTIPSEVQKAAVALADGKTSDIITIQDTNTNTDNYYFVYMIKNPGKKDSDMSKYTSQIKNYIKTTKEADSTYTASVMGSYLTKHNVIVKEKNLKNIFSNYTTSANATSSSSSSSSSSTSSSN